MRATRFFLPILVMALAACSPNRELTMDGSMDAVSETTDATDVGDVSSDACSNTECMASCTDRGYTNGFCTSSGTCFCSGLVDASDTSDVSMMDTAMDVPIESSVIGCASNADCPPTTFCNGPGCTMRGFCSPRGDITACGADGPPECGCDNMWYTNNCTRVAMGVRLNGSASACGPVPDAGTAD